VKFNDSFEDCPRGKLIGALPDARLKPSPRTAICEIVMFPAAAELVLVKVIEADLLAPTETLPKSTLELSTAKVNGRLAAGPAVPFPPQETIKSVATGSSRS
jgi:hypothetical protein